MAPLLPGEAGLAGAATRLAGCAGACGLLGYVLGKNTGREDLWSQHGAIFGVVFYVFYYIS